MFVKKIEKPKKAAFYLRKRSDFYIMCVYRKKCFHWTQKNENNNTMITNSLLNIFYCMVPSEM
jgi:hypothetical protein